MNNNDELDNRADLPPRFFHDYESEEETPTENEMELEPEETETTELNQILQFFNHEKIPQPKKKKSLINHLLEISQKATTATIINQVKTISNGNIFGKFFKIQKASIIREYIEKYPGALAMVTIKKPVWRHELILRSDEIGIWSPNLIPWEELDKFLVVENFVDVRKEEVREFWDGKEDLRQVLAVEGWRGVNVLGGLGSLLLPGNWPTSLRLPCAYESGLTLFTNKDLFT